MTLLVVDVKSRELLQGSVLFRCSPPAVPTLPCSSTINNTLTQRPGRTRFLGLLRIGAVG